MGSVGQGKGSLLVHTKDYVTRHHGASTWQALLQIASPQDREDLGGILLRGGWYPIGIVNRVTTQLCEQYARSNPDDEMRALASYIADSDLGTVYKMILGMGSPEFLMKRTGSLWNRYFDVGVLTGEEVAKSHWRLKLQMPVGEEAAPNRYYCGPGCPSWIEKGLVLTGASSARVNHVECRYDNGKYCVYDVTW